MLLLRQSTPIETGHLRCVYAHPGDSQLLIKVIRADLIGQGAPTPTWFRQRSSLGLYRPFLREFKQYLAARLHAPVDALLPISRIIGLEETDLGPGLMVEKVVSPQGGMAPTLNVWSRAAEPDQVSAALDALLAALLDYDIIASDTHAQNVVYGSDSNGGPRLLMIDGFGEKNLVPLRSISAFNNRYRTRGKFNRMRDLVMRDAGSDRLPAAADHRHGPPAMPLNGRRI